MCVGCVRACLRGKGRGERGGNGCADERAAEECAHEWAMSGGRADKPHGPSRLGSGAMDLPPRSFQNDNSETTRKRPASDSKSTRMPDSDAAGPADSTRPVASSSVHRPTPHGPGCDVSDYIGIHRGATSSIRSNAMPGRPGPDPAGPYQVLVGGCRWRNGCGAQQAAGRIATLPCRRRSTPPTRRCRPRPAAHLYYWPR